jgi:hypothetical protein
MESVQERLQQARVSRSRGPIKLAFPCVLDDALVVRYRPVKDWASKRAYIASAASDDPNEELQVAADTLLNACEGCEAHIDGETTELPHRLGRDLAAYLGFDVEPSSGRELTDREALFIMLPQDDLMEHYDLLMRESRTEAARLTEAVEGESQAS